MVSVVIPCYNAQDTITACISSVLRQTYKDLEIIVVDDGSGDKSVAVLEHYLQEIKTGRDRVSVITQKNMGPSAARNKGISMARGAYIAFLDADDQWHEDKLMSQVTVMEADKNIRLISCGYNSRPEKEQDKIRFVSFRQLLKKNYFAATSTVLIRKDALDGLSFNEQQKYAEDYRLWLQIAWQHTCAIINRPLAGSISGKLEYGQAGLSANLWKMEQGELSNYLFLYRQGRISAITLTGICCYSLLKYLRRKIIVIMKRY